eukprot:GHVO01012578.1.p1 GENE.GHVO01012578.1~~GHVO01012578.1.p1  ORF type:complete len:108 (+),score=5.18 GHVO01012578.1:206-529(+)
MSFFTSLQPEDDTGQPDFHYDEFGFKVEEEGFDFIIFIIFMHSIIYCYLSSLDGPEENSSKLLSTPFVEDAQHRLKWTAHLEFTHNHEVGDLTWEKVSVYNFKIKLK